MKLAHVTLVVQDYDKAIRFYVEKLGFKLLEDTALSPAKRWVIV
ncbi:MAG TPA: glyoxalase, partial [Cytophagales bacterium]|nr:glyoxalase [Cytophagales bacterium]